MTVLKVHCHRLYVYTCLYKFHWLHFKWPGQQQNVTTTAMYFPVKVFVRYWKDSVFPSIVRGTLFYCDDFWVLQRSTVWTLHNFIIWPCVFLCHQCNLFQQTTFATFKQIVVWVSAVFCMKSVLKSQCWMVLFKRLSAASRFHICRQGYFGIW
jgi:hypothetical protein